MLKYIRHYFSEKRTLFILICVFMMIIFIIGTIFAIYVCRVYYIKNVGITLTPSRDFEIHDIQYYLQNDPEWSDDLIGNSGSSIGGVGCLIACVSSVINDLGIPVTPKEFNAKLTEVNGFQHDGLIWYKINEAFADVDYKYSRIFSSRTIENDLKSGLLPIINVRYRGNGITHWLIVVGAKDGEFLVCDPLNADKNPVKLSVHGKVHAYRVLVPSNNRAA